MLVSKLLCCTLDKRSNICSNERAGFNNVVFRSFSGSRKYGQARGREVEFELELAALLSKLPLEGHDLVGAVSALGRSRKCVYLLECGHAYGLTAGKTSKCMGSTSSTGGGDATKRIC